MKRPASCRSIAAVCMLAAVICASAAWGQVAPPLLQIGVVDGVTIDGRIGAGEWDDTFPLSVFVDPDGAPVDPGALVRVGWDKSGLVALWSFSGNPTAERRGRDAPIWLDDAVEVHVVPGEGAPEYRFGVSASGDIYDAVDGDSSWDVLWPAIPMVGAERWHVEMRIPFAALGVMPGPGDLWRVNFIIHTADRETPPLSWAPPLAGTYASGFLRFAYIPSPVAFTRVDIAADCASIRPLIFAGASARAELFEGETPIVAHETTASEGFDLPISRPGEYRLRLAGIAPDGELTIQREFAVSVPPPLALSADMRMLHRCELELLIDASGLARTPDSFRIVAEGVPPLEIPAAGSRVARAVIDFTGRPPGPTEITVVARDLDEELAIACLLVDLPERPAWAEPVAYSPALLAERSQTVSWDFRDGLLPASARVMGSELLREPMELRVSAGGRWAQWSRVNFRWGESADAHTSALITAISDVASARVYATFHADGLLDLDLKVSPVGERSLDQVQLQIPLASRHAELLQIGDSPTAGVRIWAAARGFSSEYAPMVWLSGRGRGLQWLSGSDQGWLPARPEETIAIRGGRDDTRLVVTMVSTAMPQGISFDSSFSLQPTPVPEIDPEERRQPRLVTFTEAPIADNLCDRILLAQMRRAGVEGIVLADPRFAPRPEGLGAEAEALLLDIAQTCHDMGLALLLTIDDDISGREWDAWRDEVMVWPPGSDGEAVPPVACPASAWAGYVVAATAHALEKYGIDGIHLQSGTVPRHCASPHHQCGWTDGEQRGPTWESAAVRYLLARLRVLMDQSGGQGIISADLSRGVFVPALTYIDRVTVPAVSDGQPHELNEFRVIGDPESLGRHVEVTLPAPDDPVAFDSAVSLALLHGLEMRPAADPAAVDIASRVWMVREALEVDAARHQPWWRPGGAITTDSARVGLAVWRHSDGALAVVSNRSGSSELVELKLDRIRLGLGRVVHAEDVLTGEQVRQIGEVLRMRLAPGQTSLLWIIRRVMEGSDHNGTAEDTSGE